MRFYRETTQCNKDLLFLLFNVDSAIVTEIGSSIRNSFLGLFHYIKSKARHPFFRPSGLIPFDPAPSTGVVPAVLQHVLEVDDVEGAGDEQLAPGLLSLHGRLDLHAGALVILPPAASTFVEPLATILVATCEPFSLSEKVRVVQIIRRDFSSTHGAPFRLQGDPFDTEKAEDVFARQLDWVDAGLKSPRTFDRDLSAGSLFNLFIPLLIRLAFLLFIFS